MTEAHQTVSWHLVCNLFLDGAYEYVHKRDRPKPREMFNGGYVYVATDPGRPLCCQ